MTDSRGGARLFVLAGPDLGRSFPLAERTTLGRSDECGIVLRDRSISRKHAVLVLEEGRWFAEDLGSTNGISKDGKRTPRFELADGDEFKLGDLLLRLRLDAESVPAQEIEFEVGPAPAQASAPPPSPVSARAPPPPPSARDRVESDLEIEDEIQLEEPDAPPPPGAPRPPSSVAAPRPPRAERRTGLFAADLEQQPLWQRTLIFLVLLALGSALAYGAFLAVGLLRAG
jgi:pSer/pThr/pTyr-binding forkhead associated (FHA) protein